MIQNQQSMVFSSYMDIYELVVPKDNLLRKINDLIDFSFVYEELKDKYCHDNDRNAIDPIRMFKYLLLKTIYDLSDVDVVDRSKYDMSFKYFLYMAPEEHVIEPSSLTKFRKLRLEDISLLDMLINKTMEIAIENKIIKSTSIIVDSTHTKSRYTQKSPKEILVDRSKKLRKAVYKIDENMKNKFPPKNTTNILKEEIDYYQQLIQVIEKEDTLSQYPKIKESLNLLKETVVDDIEHLQISEDQDAKIGHKTVDLDTKHIEKSIEAGRGVESVIGDAAYSEKGNITYANKNTIKLVAKLNATVTHGVRKKENEFEFNKDAGMYVCKAGHMVIRTTRHGKKGVGKNQRDTYYFDIKKCKHCPFKEGAKSKTYSVSIKSNEHIEQTKFQETDYFKEKAKERYKIEAKNSELKHRHGYNVAKSSSLIGMQLQGAMAIFTVNLKRILKLIKIENQGTQFYVKKDSTIHILNVGILFLIVRFNSFKNPKDFQCPPKRKGVVIDFYIPSIPLSSFI